jgi:hypothetical protein
MLDCLPILSSSGSSSADLAISVALQQDAELPTEAADEET